MRVCIAEDDSTSRAMLEALLRKWGYETLAAQDGAQAWELLQSMDAPKLVLLDWNMPRLDGLEITCRLRAQALVARSYIIVITSKGEKENVAEALNAGADDYVSKPFEPEVLRARIGAGKRMLELQSDLIEAREALSRALANS